jgi:hypothetical protein
MDILVIYDESITQMNTMTKEFNTIYPTIEFTTEND